MISRRKENKRHRVRAAMRATKGTVVLPRKEVALGLQLNQGVASMEWGIPNEGGMGAKA